VKGAKTKTLVPRGKLDLRVLKGWRNKKVIRGAKVQKGRKKNNANKD
jgi:hypothetical protein